MYDIAGHQILAQPVTAFFQGRALALSQEAQQQNMAIQNAQNVRANDANTRANQDQEIQNQSAKVVFGKQLAEKVLAGSELTIESANPKKFVQDNYPEFLDELRKKGADVDAMDDNDMREYAQHLKSHAMAELGRTPVQTVTSPNGGILQKDPVTGAVKQVVAPDYEPQKLAQAASNSEETKRHNRALEANASAKLDANNFDPEHKETIAQMIAKGEMAPPTGRNAFKPEVVDLMSRVKEISPGYDAKDYPNMQRSLYDFSSGQSAKAVTALNVGIQHLDTYSRLADELGNTNSPAYNRIANFFQQQTGRPAPTNVTTAKQLLAGEITKIITANGGTGEDRTQAQEVLDNANSPTQLKGAVKTIQDLFGGRLQGLALQYKNGTKRDDFASHLSPAAQEYLTNDPGEHVRDATPGAKYRHSSGATIEIVE